MRERPERPKDGDRIKMIGGPMHGETMTRRASFKYETGFEELQGQESHEVAVYEMKLHKGEWVYLCTHNPTEENPVDKEGWKE